MKKIVIAAACLVCMSILFNYNARGEMELIAPDFRIQDLDKNTVELKNFRGKPVLLFFWTTWCPFCLKELKTLNKTSVELSKKGVELLVINTSEREHNARRVAKNYNLSFRVFLDEDGSVADAFGVYGVPTFVLIDKNGNLVFSDNTFPREEIDMLCPQKSF
jgi:peroxiredoxin